MMARYDRIAPLNSPTRNDAFPGWLALRDLEGRERDADLGRRARLRFLAVRMVRRVIREGFERLPAASFERQIEGVREELGQLATRDIERARLADFLHVLQARSSTSVCKALIEVGTVAKELGHIYAAEECFLTSRDLATSQRHATGEADALRAIGALYEAVGRGDEAEEALKRAAQLALQADERVGWARAVQGLASLASNRDQPLEARRVLQSALERGLEWQDARVTAIAAQQLAELSLAADDVEGSLHFAWTAFRAATGDEVRARLMLLMARAFRRVGLTASAETAYEAVLSNNSTVPALVVQAEQALAAAEAGDTKTYATRRARVVDRISEAARQPQLYASLHLTLARGAVLTGAVDFARDHIRDSIATARKHVDPATLTQADDLLSALETMAAGGSPKLLKTLEPGPIAKRIAAEVSAATTLIHAN
jgi:tetratricopeptide (TPR) repeat protein